MSMPVYAIPIAKRLLDFESRDGELFVCLVLPRPTFPTCLDPSCQKCPNGHFPKLGVPSWGFHIKDDDILRSVLGSRHPFYLWKRPYLLASYDHFSKLVFY